MTLYPPNNSLRRGIHNCRNGWRRDLKLKTPLQNREPKVEYTTLFGSHKQHAAYVIIKSNTGHKCDLPDERWHSG